LWWMVNPFCLYHAWTCSSEDKGGGSSSSVVEAGQCGGHTTAMAVAIAWAIGGRKVTQLAPVQRLIDTLLYDNSIATSQLAFEAVSNRHDWPTPSSSGHGAPRSDGPSSRRRHCILLRQTRMKQ
jgi:hypothetical protein